MRNGRTISIKDPKLQKIRNNLRLIIMKECSKRKSAINDQKYDLTHGKDGKYVKISDETSEILQELSNKWWEIERPLRASIVKCATCNKHTRDMTYHKNTRSWYCTWCYERNFGLNVI